MNKLNKVKQKIRKDKKWGFLAEMVGETAINTPVMGVDYKGVLRVNPTLALPLSTEVLVGRVRAEFKTAQELRQVRGFN